MALMAATSISHHLLPVPQHTLSIRRLPRNVNGSYRATNIQCSSSLSKNIWMKSTDSCSTFVGGVRSLRKPLSATGSGLQASIPDPEDIAISVKNPNIVVEYQDDNKIQVRVDLTGEDTRTIFDKVLMDLARTVPPVPGFRRQKGGKTSKVPKNLLLLILGEDRVMNFVIQEIVSSTLADYAKKENLNVKDKKVNTTQTAEELKSAFTPGNQFVFNAVLELEKLSAEISCTEETS